jgi:protein associated with RNAse G/E
VVRLSKQKWTTASGSCTEAFSWPAHVLGTDRHGTWLGARRGNPVQQADGRVEPQQHDAVWLVVENAWYLPAFWFTSETDLTIDICTPPSFEDGTWSFVDMELDLFRRSDGHAGVVDQDDWDLLVGSGLISDDAVRAVEETARSLLALVEHRVEPFGHAALPWLDSLHHART